MYSAKDWGSIGIQIDSSFILTLTLIVVKKARVLMKLAKYEPVVKYNIFWRQILYILAIGNQKIERIQWKTTIHLLSFISHLSYQDRLKQATTFSYNTVDEGVI